MSGGLLALVQTAAIVGFSFLVTHVIVRAIAGETLGALAPALLLLAGVVAVRFLVGWLSDINAARGAAVVKSELRGRVLRAVTQLGPGWLGSRNATAVGVTTGPGLDALDTYFAKYLPQLVLTAIAMPLIVVVIWSEDWISGLIVTATLPLIPVFMVLIGWATQTVQARQWDKLSRLSTAFLDVVGGLSTLTIYGRQHRQAARIRAVTDDYRSETMRVLRISFLSGFALELAASLSVALVAVSVGVRLIEGSLGLGVGLFVLLLAPEAFLPLRNVGAQFHAAADGVAASSEVFDILDAAEAADAAGADAPVAADTPAGADAPAGAGVVPRAVSDATDARAGSAASPRSAGPDATGADAIGADAAGPGTAGPDSGSGSGLVVRGLGVRYGESVVIDGLDAQFLRGSVAALAGPSGSGKSSLVAALLGFVPHTGEIRLDGREVASGARDWLAWSGQRAAMIPGTVGRNVALGDDEPDEAAARAALDLVGGAGIRLDTVIDARGDGLSGGQAQRVAGARAVYRARRLDCAVVVFDEPSSALDTATERDLIGSLRVLADEGRAVLVVSHRRAVIDAADSVMRMRAGVEVRS